MYTTVFPDGTILHIEDLAINMLFMHIQKHKTDMEAGGILLGKRYQKREEYIISDISELDERDIRSRFAFVRSKHSAQRIINQLWAESNGIINYLGEWHTHPEYRATPSQVDKKLIEQIIHDHSNVFVKVFLIIIGTDQSLYVGMADSSISNNIIFSKRLGETK